MTNLCRRVETDTVHHTAGRLVRGVMSAIAEHHRRRLTRLGLPPADRPSAKTL
jgi:hypothetical protein